MGACSLLGVVSAKGNQPLEHPTKCVAFAIKLVTIAHRANPEHGVEAGESLG